MNASRRIPRTIRLLVACAVAVAGASSIAVAAAGRPDSGTAWVSVTHAEGSTLFVGGDIKDKILGRAAIVYQTALSTDEPGTVKITAKTVTLYTKTGSLTGTGY